MQVSKFSKYKIKIHHDSRGWFKESYNKLTYDNIFRKFKVIQSNITLSKKINTIRGFHYQKSKYGQNKILQLLSGSIDDYALCINKKSKNYLKLFKIELSKLDEIIFIPKDYAHCIVTKKNDTLLNYYVDNFYNSENEVTINPLNVFKKMVFFRSKIHISEKDLNGILL